MINKFIRITRCALLPCILFSLYASATVNIDSQGWTHVSPSQDSRVVYVSSSEGNNINDGLSPETPKATIEAGNRLLRDGYPDHLLLKRGDEFSVATQSGLGRWKSGRNPDEPILISSYGDSGPRPVVYITGHFINHDGAKRDYQAIIGLDLYKAVSDPDSDLFNNTDGGGGIRMVGSGDHILMEDNRFRFIMVTVQSYGEGIYSEFKFRRNIILDSWSHGSFYSHDGRVQGLYMSEVDGYLLEENFFDHNGWNEVIEGAGANMYNHNVYIQYNCMAGGIMRGNIFSMGAAHGMQARSGGIVDRNLFVRNAVSVNIGGHGTPTDPNVNEFNNRCTENVILEGRLMNPGGDNSNPRTTAVWAISGSYFTTVVSDNIIANRRDSGNNNAYPGIEWLQLSNNIVYAWDSTRDTFDPDWPHPDDTLGDYNESIGGENSFEAYLEPLRNRPPGELPWELTAYSANSYIREGFNKPATGGYYDYPGQPASSATGVKIVGGTASIETGESTTFSYSMEPLDASNPLVTWSSSNPSVAEIKDYGRVRGLNAGTTWITATTADGGFVDSVELVVVAGEVQVTGIQASTVLLGLKVPETSQLGATVLPENATNQSIVWSSTNPSVATVDQTGLVKAVSAGSVDIIVTTEDGGFSDSVAIVVSPGSLAWADYTMDADGNVDTGDFLGWIAVEGDWIWNFSLNHFLFLPENNVTQSGAWTYFPRFFKI